MFESEEHILRRVGASLANEQDGAREFLIDNILKAQKVFIYGVGRSGTMCKAFAIRMVQMGLKVFFIGETITPIVEKDDLVIIVSNTGETMSAIQTANIVRRLGASVIAITAENQSKLAHAASSVIHLKVEKNSLDSEYSPLGTIFEITALVFLDGIVSELMKRLGQTEANMRARHAIWV
ncbi:MAG: SIS domain-containing protein [Candidatus Thermoplasmatota archaeon]|nr:SIS domain-containing protein [Euryarchaeota archaeon]MBU4032108.1 SIS domain-containing protein [Candidatus Thermoplasmatota archaeon]MBU4144874.1 SIS domain-containing protein [Candidatus Thermoplasmatota archaeon]MBU4592663.1 SIS domain-containing protein [Candidatus Thermoplasmatota archaeon]